MVANQALFDIYEAIRQWRKQKAERLSSPKSINDQPLDVQVAVAYGESNQYERINND